MDSDAFKADVNQLDALLDGLEQSLQPLLSNPVSATASKIPLLDKAKLYTLTTYAIESLLFSAIRLDGQDAKDHAVFKELARIKQYFDKIKAVEEAGVKPTSRLDKDAAQRMIKHGLAGNNERMEQKGATWTGSKRKFDDEEARSAGSAEDPSKALASSIDTLVDEGQRAATKAARKAERKASRQVKKSKTKS